MRITVVGAGSWGTTLADLLVKNGNDVVIWAREPEVVESINERHENEVFLPDISLSPNLKASGDIPEALDGAELVVSAAPSHAVRTLARKIAEGLGEAAQPRVVSISKGLDPTTHETMTEILQEEISGVHVAALSGPSFAREVASEVPTAVVVAAHEVAVAKEAQRAFSNHYFRVYSSRDVLGVELGGALKNVVAIASGIVDGLKLGDNARAALITRGLAEMSRLGIEMGANPLTFSGLAGMGDLMLTCSGDQSRNRTLGKELARGRSLEEIKSARKSVAEGVNTSDLVLKLAEEYDVELPIAAEVHAILFEQKKPQDAIRDLMERELKAEHHRG